MYVGVPSETIETELAVASRMRANGKLVSLSESYDGGYSCQIQTSAHLGIATLRDCNQMFLRRGPRLLMSYIARYQKCGVIAAQLCVEEMLPAAPFNID